MKTCRKCGSEKTRKGDGRLYCKACARERARKYRAENLEAIRERDRVAARNRDPWRKKINSAAARYGISQEEASELYLRKVCDSCGEPDPKGKSLHIDHDHKTGRIRGALCHGCNVSLGNLNDSPIKILKLLNYLVDNS